MSDDLDPRNETIDVLNREVFYKGKTIIEQGAPAYRAYYIESGRVEVMVNEENHNIKVSELGPGEIFGEMALIQKEERSATVKVVEDCTVTVISKKELEDKIGAIKNPAIQGLIYVLVERLREATKGQVLHYKNLANFQDRITGLVDKVALGVTPAKRDQFNDEVTPLLDQLDAVLNKYRRS